MNNKILAPVVKTIFVPKGNPDIKEVRAIQAIPLIKNIEGDQDELTVTGEMEMKLVYLPVFQAEKNIPWQEIDLEKAENEKYQDWTHEDEENDWRRLEAEMAREEAGSFNEDWELNLLIPFTLVLETRTVSREPVMKFVPTVDSVNWTVVSPKALECEMILNLGEKREIGELPAEQSWSNRETEEILTENISDSHEDIGSIGFRTEISEPPQTNRVGEQPGVGDEGRYGSWEEPTEQITGSRAILTEKEIENVHPIKEVGGILVIAPETVLDMETFRGEKKSDRAVKETVDHQREADTGKREAEREAADPLPESAPKKEETDSDDRKAGDTGKKEVEQEAADPLPESEPKREETDSDDRKAGDIGKKEVEQEAADSLPEAGPKREDTEAGDYKAGDTGDREVEQEAADPLPEAGPGPVGVTYSYRESIFLMPFSKKYYRIKFYRVQFGEDLDAIADKLGVSKESIQRVNSISEEEIRAGTLLSIPTNSG